MSLTTLTLMRHAKAEPGFVGGDDLARGLTDRGKSDAQNTANILVQKNTVPDLILASSSRRTLETARILKDIVSAEIKIEEALYLAEPETIKRFVDDVAGQSTSCIIVGHNPGLHQLSLEWLSQSKPDDAQTIGLHHGMPTASAAIFEVAMSGSSGQERMSFVDFITPK